DVREAVGAMKPIVARQQCFYTLDSAGVWFYLFDRPSCSRFHQITYARSEQAQLEVIEALRRERPEVILFRGYDSWPGVDEPANAGPPVPPHALREYRPRSVAGGHWFWQRAAAPLAVGNRPVAGAATVIEDAPPGTVRVTGWVEPPAGASW